MPLNIWDHIGKSLGRIGSGAVSGAVTGGIAGGVPTGGAGAIPGAIVGGIGGGALGLINAIGGWGTDDQEAAAQDQAQAAQQGIQQQVSALQQQTNPYQDPNAVNNAVMANNNAVTQQFNGAARNLRAQLAARGLLGGGAEAAGMGAIGSGQATALSQGQLGIRNAFLDKGVAFDQDRQRRMLEALTGQQNHAQGMADALYQQQAAQDSAVGSTIANLGQTAMLLPMFGGAAQQGPPAPTSAYGAGDMYGPEPVHQPLYPTPNGEPLNVGGGAPMRPLNAAAARGSIANQMRWRLGGLQGGGIRSPSRVKPSLGYSPVINNDDVLDRRLQ